MVRAKKTRTILQINDLKGTGGAEICAALMARLYEAHGNSVIRFYGKKTVSSPIRRVYNFKEKRRLERVLGGEEVSFAHVHNFHETLGPAILRPLKERGIRTIATLHDYHLICPVVTLDCGDARSCTVCDIGRRKWRFPLDRIQSAIGKGLLGSIGHFICPSRFLLKEFENRKFPYRDRLEHIPNGVFPDDYVPRFPKEARTFYFGGKLIFPKGLANLVKAFEELSKDDMGVRLVISGDGRARRWLTRYIETRGLSGTIEYVGRLSQIEMDRLRSRVDVGILPSLWPENASMFLLEMMAFGKPLIASDAGGNPELVENGKNGLIYERSSVQGLVDAIRDLTSSPGRVVRFGKASRKRIERDFDLDRLYKRYLALMD